MLVNRVWQHHFGRGLVGTPSNFGLLGERPTHPELLDHLAAQFVASGWSIKQLHREIMLSATYRCGVRNAECGIQVLPFRTPNSHFRIPSIPTIACCGDRTDVGWTSKRGAIPVLSVCGNFDPAMGGPSLNLNDGNNRRRTLYAAVSRHDLNSTLRLFDFPDPN